MHVQLCIFFFIRFKTTDNLKSSLLSVKLYWALAIEINWTLFASLFESLTCTDNKQQAASTDRNASLNAYFFQLLHVRTIFSSQETPRFRNWIEVHAAMCYQLLWPQIVPSSLEKYPVFKTPLVACAKYMISLSFFSGVAMFSFFPEIVIFSEILQQKNRIIVVVYKRAHMLNGTCFSEANTCAFVCHYESVVAYNYR